MWRGEYTFCVHIILLITHNFYENYLVGKIIKLGPFYKLIIKMGLFHFYLPREFVILLQSAYLRGAFQQNATLGVT